MRTTITRVTTAVAALVLVLTAFASTLTANAEERYGLSIDHGSVTFHNYFEKPLTISWTDGEDLSGEVVIDPGHSEDIEAMTKHFIYSAFIKEGIVGQAEWPGLDLRVKKDTKPTKPAKPSLPNTGV